MSRREKSKTTGTKVDLQSHDSFFGDNWKTQSKIRKKMGKSPGGNGNRNHINGISNGIMDDIDLVLGDSDTGSDDNDGDAEYNSHTKRHSRGGGSSKYDNDEDVVKVGRHALPRFESLLGDDEFSNEADTMVSNGRNSRNGNDGNDRNDGNDGNEERKRAEEVEEERERGRRRKKKKKKEQSGASKINEEEDMGRDEGKSEEQPRKKVKKKKKKKKKKGPRPPSPIDEPVPMTGASANTVRMDSNFMNDDWDSD